MISQLAPGESARPDASDALHPTNDVTGNVDSAKGTFPIRRQSSELNQIVAEFVSRASWRA